MKRFIFVLVLMVVSFLVGYLPLYMGNRDLTTTLEQTGTDYRNTIAMLEEHLDVARLQNRLGLIMVELDRNNAGRALELAGPFFDEVTALSFNAQSPAVASRLSDIAEKRDVITVSLAAPTPDTEIMLRDLFLEMGQVYVN